MQIKQVTHSNEKGFPQAVLDPALGNAEVSGAWELLTRESLFKLQGFSKEHMKALYSLAYTRYSIAQYEDSEKIFILLCLLEHKQKRNWVGLGASRQMNKNYIGAVYAYMQASHMDQASPAVWVYLAECLLELHQISEAEAALRQASDRCGSMPEHEKFRQKIQFLKTYFFKKNSKSILNK